MINSHTRSIAKSFSWRITATITTITLVFIFTGDLTISLGIGAWEFVLKFVFFYLHERFWDKIRW